MTDKPNLKPEWIILLLTSLGVAAVFGRPIGNVVALLGAYIHDGSVSAAGRNLCSRLQLVDAIGYHHVAGRHAAFDRRLIPFVRTGHDRELLVVARPSCIARCAPNLTAPRIVGQPESFFANLNPC